MNILLLSEHYFPKISGTVSYVENTAISLAKKGMNVYLLIPSLGKLGEINVQKNSSTNVTLLSLGVSEQDVLCFNANERTYLCNWVNKNITTITKQYDINVVHLLVGLYLAEALNTKVLYQLGIKTILTIHNIPPFECSTSWKGDKFYYYLKDEIRKIGVRLVNKRRIQKNNFDIYIADCNIVKYEIEKYIKKSKIYTIGLGGAEYIDTTPRTLKSSSTINILTVGGIVPHKNQHLIPSITNYLKQEGIDFKWDIVGPNRNQRYFNEIKKEILDLKLGDYLSLNTSVNDEELKKYYSQANLYIQLSSEEGFCLTVLDAIAYGIPVLGTPVGGIPEMLEMVGGTIIENNIDTLKPIIAHYIKILNSLTVSPELLNEFKKNYTWPTAAEHLIQLYRG